MCRVCQNGYGRNKNTSLVDVDWSREISAVQIYVERVIGV